jgi:hypothetical protein
MLEELHIELKDLPKEMYITAEEAKHDPYITNTHLDKNYLGYVDIYKKFNIVTYKGHKIVIQE